jgi:DUF2934 family protein
VATRKSPKTQTTKTAKAGANNRSTRAASGPSNGNGSPSFAQIQTRAYELFEARGRCDGDDWQDWFEAEQQLLRNSA